MSLMGCIKLHRRKPSAHRLVHSITEIGIGADRSQLSSRQCGAWRTVKYVQKRAAYSSTEELRADGRARPGRPPEPQR